MCRWVCLTLKWWGFCLARFFGRTLHYNQACSGACNYPHGEGCVLTPKGWWRELAECHCWLSPCLAAPVVGCAQAGGWLYGSTGCSSHGLTQWQKQKGTRMPSAASPVQNLFPQAVLLGLALSLSVQRGRLGTAVKHLHRNSVSFGKSWWRWLMYRFWDVHWW